MKFKGKGISGTNAAGWERNHSKYFRDILEKHPEFWSNENVERIENDLTPIVDDVFMEYFPQYNEYLHEGLLHHHVGGGGQAVAVPKSIHEGFGGIHNFEKELGIRNESIIQ